MTRKKNYCGYFVAASGWPCRALGISPAGGGDFCGLFHLSVRHRVCLLSPDRCIRAIQREAEFSMSLLRGVVTGMWTMYTLDWDPPPPPQGVCPELVADAETTRRMRSWQLKMGSRMETSHGKIWASSHPTRALMDF